MKTPDQRIKLLESEVKTLQKEIVKLTSLNIDLHGRRVINASHSHHDNDYIIRAEIPKLVKEEIAPAAIFDLKKYNLLFTPKRLNYGSFTLDDIDIQFNNSTINVKSVPIDGIYVVAACIDEISITGSQNELVLADVTNLDNEVTITTTADPPTDWEVGDYILINNPAINPIADRFSFEIFLIKAIEDNVVTLLRDNSSVDTLFSWFGTPKSFHFGTFYAYKVDILNFPFEFKNGIFLNPSSRTGYAERLDVIIPNVCVVGTSVALYNSSGFGRWINTLFSTGIDTPNQWESGDITSPVPGLRTLNGAAYLVPTSGTLSVGLESDFSIRPNANAPIRCLWGYIDIAPVTIGSTDPVCTIQVIEVDESDLSETVIETVEFYTGEIVSGELAYPPETRQVPYNPKPDLLGDNGGFHWPVPTLHSDRRYKTKVTAIGSNTAGSNLIMVLSS